MVEVAGRRTSVFSKELYIRVKGKVIPVQRRVSEAILGNVFKSPCRTSRWLRG